MKALGLRFLLVNEGDMVYAGHEEVPELSGESRNSPRPMEPTSTASIKTARWFLAALLAVNLYRAMTQSVTPGEAWNYDRFIGPAWAESLAAST